MRSTAPVTTTASDRKSSLGESFGARLAEVSRRQQGLSPTVSEPNVRDSLRVLCALPRARVGSGVPDELDPTGQ